MNAPAEPGGRKQSATMKEKLSYRAPELLRLDILVETGFAASIQQVDGNNIEQVQVDNNEMQW